MNNSNLLTTEDLQRLSSQLERVEALMGDQKWRTLRDIAMTVFGSEASCSARLRDLRKRGYSVEKRRTEIPGLFEYRVLQVQPVELRFDEVGQGAFL